MRTLIIFLVLLSGLLIACVDGSTQTEKASTQLNLSEFPFERDPSGIYYVSADGHQIFFSFGRMEMLVGPTADRLSQMFRRGEEVLISSSPIRDCSNELVACLASRHFVFAVPRHGLFSGMSYSAEGQRFIATCQDSSCRVADIRAVCERVEDGACSLAGNGVGRVNARSIFTFDVDAGVVPIELGPGATGEPARRGILVGNRGILAPPTLGGSVSE
jgi:hypothetical protein